MVQCTLDLRVEMLLLPLEIRIEMRKAEAIYSGTARDQRRCEEEEGEMYSINGDFLSLFVVLWHDWH